MLQKKQQLSGAREMEDWMQDQTGARLTVASLVVVTVVLVLHAEVAGK